MERSLMMEKALLIFVFTSQDKDLKISTMLVDPAPIFWMSAVETLTSLYQT